MPTPVAPAWASLVVYVDVAVVLGAAVTALLATGRKQGTPGRASGGVWVAAALVAWLGIVLALNSAHVFQARSHGVPWIGLGVGAPIVVGFVAFSLSRGLRRSVASIPQPWLLAAQFPRLVGAIFLVLLAEHRLPGVFARPAGWGDVLIGVMAPLVTYAYVARRSWSRSLAVLFNFLGIADLVIAIGTGFLAHDRAPDGAHPHLPGPLLDPRARRVAPGTPRGRQGAIARRLACRLQGCRQGVEEPVLRSPGAAPPGDLNADTHTLRTSADDTREKE